MVSKQEFNPGFRSGTYAGDGAATLAIVGVGFQPKFVMIYPQIPGTGGYYVVFKCSDDGAFAFISKAGLRAYEVDHIISLDADGFTVGDGPGGIGNFMNVNLRNYAYQAWAEGT